MEMESQFPQWSDLPVEILTKISTQHLKTQTDLRQFRSVCSSWRSSSPPHLIPPSTLIFPSPIKLNPYYTIYEQDSPRLRRFCALLESTIYLVRPRDTHHHNDGNGVGTSKEWLIKVEEKNPEVVRLVKPLSRLKIEDLPKSFPKVFNLSNFRTYELCKEYGLHHPQPDKDFEREITVQTSPNGNILVRQIYLGEYDNLDVKKLALLSLNLNSRTRVSDDYLVLGVYLRGELILFKPGDGNRKWVYLECENLDLRKFRCHDVVEYVGKFYAVDCNGRIVVIDSSLNVNLLVSSIDEGGRRKRLVKSNGDLFLVDVYIDFGPEYVEWNESSDLVYYDGDGTPSPCDFCGVARPIGCQVYKLDESTRSWIKVESLDDCVFVVGERSSFSISASELTGCKGNCILFTDFFFCEYGKGYDEEADHTNDIGVYNLEDGSFQRLQSYPSYEQLFWPPPPWVLDKHQQR